MGIEPSVRIQVIRDLYQERELTLAASAAILSASHLAAALMKKEQAFFAWFDPRYRPAARKTGRSRLRLCATLHYASSALMEGAIKPGRKPSPFVVMAHAVVTNAADRKCTVRRRMVATLPCAFTEDTSIEDIALSGPTATINDRDYLESIGENSDLTLERDDIAITHETWRVRS